jgi:uncharacterized protein YcfJ
MRLEDLTPCASVRGILPDAAVAVVNVQWRGSDALTLICRDPVRQNGRAPKLTARPRTVSNCAASPHGIE